MKSGLKQAFYAGSMIGFGGVSFWCGLGLALGGWSSGPNAGGGVDFTTLAALVTAGTGAISFSAFHELKKEIIAEANSVVQSKPIEPQ